MATVDYKEIVDAIIAGDGYYEDDQRVVKIVQYTNRYGPRPSYGLIYEGDRLDKYAESEYVINPVTLWEAKTPPKPKPSMTLRAIPGMTLKDVLEYKIKTAINRSRKEKHDRE